MNNNQKNNSNANPNVNEEPVLQPINDNGTVNNQSVQPTVNQQPQVPVNNQPVNNQVVADSNVVQKNNNQNNNKELESRILTESSAKTAINMAAYSNIEEKPKKEVKEYVEKPHAGARRFFGFFFLIILIAFAFFLPNISDMVGEYKKDKENATITSGQLRCSMTKNSDTLSVNYEQNFRFTNNKIVTYNYKEENKGSNEDSKELAEIDNKCRLLDQNCSNLEGVSVSCEATSTSVVIVQNIDLDKVKLDSLVSAYTESGGQYPEFEFGESVDSVQSEVQKAGYQCEKIK